MIKDRWYSYEVRTREEADGSSTIIANPGRVNYVVRKIPGDVDAQGTQWLRGTQIWYKKKRGRESLIFLGVDYGIVQTLTKYKNEEIATPTRPANREPL